MKTKKAKKIIEKILRVEILLIDKTLFGNDVHYNCKIAFQKEEISLSICETISINFRKKTVYFWIQEKKLIVFSQLNQLTEEQIQELDLIEIQMQ
jgi:hypothetical protein